MELPQKAFTIYRSSAGSGKTYTLTRDYISLALKNPQYFRTILAVTFTNKATQEMKSRILETLHQLAEGEQHSMIDDLSEITGLNSNKIIERAHEVRSAILHNYSHFAVSTIDSFFQKIVRSFAKEVGLRSGFKVELDQAKVLDVLIDELLDLVGKDKHLTKWLMQFAEEQLDEGKNWDIRRSIRSLASEIFNETYKVHETALQHIADNENVLGKALSQLKKLRQDFEQQMDRLGQEALLAMEEEGLSVPDFAYGASGAANYFIKIQKQTAIYDPTKRVLEVLEDPAKWSTKSNKRKDVICGFGEAKLQPILSQALEIYSKDYRLYRSAIEVLRNIYTLGILANLSRLLKEYRDKEDILLISDAAVFLKDIIGDNETPFIYEKTGSNYRHFLIDEFQDTSGFQWDNFKPLVANSVASGDQNLVVGDVKQSIYRWRGGNWKILLEEIEQDIGHHNTQVKPLAQNWRSCPLIIDFNNSLFYKASHELLEACIEKINEHTDELEAKTLAFEALHLTQAYAEVSQQYPANKPEQACGLVKVQFLQESEETGKWKVQAQEAMLASIRQLQDNGYRPKDITILVRSNGDGKELANVLMLAEQNKESDKYCYSVISSDALYISSATTIGVVLHALRVLHKPGDAISRVNLAYDFQRYILDRHELSYHHLFSLMAAENYTEYWQEYLPSDFVGNLMLLSKLPLYELVETLLDTFQLASISGEWAYLQAFQDAVLRYSLDERGDLDTFLDWWEETGSRRTVQISESVDAIRIYTVHTSKGLQFKAVLLPYCQWELNHKPSATNYLWTNSQIKPLNEFAALPIKYSSKLQNTVFAQNYYREMLQAYLDNLNLLYVAFTRAENCLLAWVPLPSLKSSAVPKADYVNSLLYRLLALQHQNPHNQKATYLDFEPGWNSDKLYYECGKLERLQQKKGNEPVAQFALANYPNTKWRNRLLIRKRNASLALAADAELAVKINWNRTLHALLQLIERVDDLDNALETIYYEGLITETEKPAVRQQMHDLFNHCVAGKWFNPEWKVRTELPLLSEEGSLLRPDRVISLEGNAIAIDFILEEPQKHHTYRVAQYLNLLSRMEFSTVQGFVFYMETGMATPVNFKGEQQLNLGL